MTERKEDEEQDDLSSVSNDALVGGPASTFDFSFISQYLGQEHVDILPKDISPKKAWFPEPVQHRHVMQGSDQGLDQGTSEYDHKLPAR